MPLRGLGFSVGNAEGAGYASPAFSKRVTHSDTFPLRGQSAVGPAGGYAADGGVPSVQKVAASAPPFRTSGFGHSANRPAFVGVSFRPCPKKIAQRQKNILTYIYISRILYIDVYLCEVM